MRPKHNKQYANKQTKRNQLFITNLKASIFIIALMAIIINQAVILTNDAKTTTSNNNNTSTLNINDLTIININSNYPENEKTAYLAIYQAIDKHMSTATRQQKDVTARDLIAIAHQENRDFNYKSTGADSYTSYGLFQISLHYHPTITISQALDPYFSADWTLARLIRNGYLTGNRNNAIRLHNGSITNDKTAHYLQDINNYILNIK